MGVKNQHLLITCAFWISLVVIVSSLAYFAISSLNMAIQVSTYAADGTFQLYNPLSRIHSGQTVGGDFPFFHGVGVPFIHLPLFELLGHNLFAAEAAKWFMSPFIFLISSFLFFWAYLRNWRYATIATAGFTMLAVPYIDVVYPGNSLVGIRSTMPILVAAFILWKPALNILIKGENVSLYYPVLALLFALAVALGTEQGLAAIVAYLVIELIRVYRRYAPLLALLKTFVKGVAIAIGVLLVLSLLTAGNAIDALHYALVSVAKDQGWYFGAPPNDFLRVETLNYLFDKNVLKFIPVLILGIATYAVVVYRKLVSEKIMWVLHYMVLYGVIVFAVSSTGYWAPSAQLIPLNRVAGVILIAATTGYVMSLVTKRVKSHQKKRPQSYLTILAYGVVVAFSLNASYTIYTFAKNTIRLEVRYTVLSAKEKRKSDDYSALNTLWKERVDTFRPFISKNDTVWETYKSMYGRVLGTPVGPRMGEDYIIHALGPDRRSEYGKDFIKSNPKFVTTLQPSYFWYEEWLWTRHWDVYQHLLSHYEIVSVNDSHILWRRLPEPIPQTGNEVSVPAQKDGSYILPSNAGATPIVYTASVTYTITGSLPGSSKVSRYLLNLSNLSGQRFPVSLPPYEKTWQFPIIVMPGDKNIRLTPWAAGFAPKVGLTINSLKIVQRSYATKSAYMFKNNYCSFGGYYTYKAKDGDTYRSFKCTIEDLYKLPS